MGNTGKHSTSVVVVKYFRVTEYLYKRAIHLFVVVVAVVVVVVHHHHPKIEFADLRNI